MEEMICIPGVARKDGQCGLRECIRCSGGDSSGYTCREDFSETSTCRYQYYWRKSEDDGSWEEWGNT